MEETKQPKTKRFWTYKSNCSICQLAKKDAQFRQRVRYAAFSRVQGDETLADIAKEFGLSQPSIYNHARKHISDTSIIMEDRRKVVIEKKVAEHKAEAMKELNIAIDADSMADVDFRPEEIVALDDYIAQGAAKIKNHEMKMTPQTFLAAIKIKTDWSAKNTHNKLEFLKTVNAFRSGAQKDIKKIKEGEIVNEQLTGKPTESIDRGQDEASNIYREAFGNAIARGTEEIYTGNDTTEPEN